MGCIKNIKNFLLVLVLTTLLCYNVCVCINLCNVIGCKIMKKILKNTISSIIIISVIFSTLLFSGCGTSTKTAIRVNGVEISNDVFTYFLDKAAVDLGTEVPFNALCEKAEEYLSTYFKTNSLAHKEGVTLSLAEKANVSTRVNNCWNIFGKYYKKIGVSKETLTKIYTADAYRTALLTFYYGTGGADEIPVSRLYAQFRTNYIVFQSITGYFTYSDLNGNQISVSENEREAIILKYQNVASMINQGEQDLEQAAEYLAEDGYGGSVQTVVLHKDDTSYPAGFFKKVQSTETRIATVIGTNEYIFLVLRGDADVNSTYFNDKKTEMIENIVGDEIDVRIENSLTTDFDLSRSVAKGYYTLILDEKK